MTTLATTLHTLSALDAPAAKPDLATADAYADVIGRRIHTGALRLNRRTWTTLAGAIASQLVAERKDLAYCVSIQCDPGTVGIIERRIARLVEAAEALDAATVQTARECREVAARADDEVTP